MENDGNSVQHKRLPEEVYPDYPILKARGTSLTSSTSFTTSENNHPDVSRDQIEDNLPDGRRVREACNAPISITAFLFQLNC